MAKQIQALRETLIKQLSSIKEDNVSVADIIIDRRKLLEALKLQSQPDADVININYGKVSWHYDYRNYSDGKWEYEPHTKEPEPCIQFSCNHTIMRFLNKPKQARYGQELKVIPLNFVDHAEYVKPKLSGIPLDTQELISALTFVQHGIAIEEGRPVLNCVLFDSGDDTLKLVTADGFRLSTAKFTVKGIPQDKVLIHRSDISKLLTFLKSNTDGKGKHKAWLDTYMKSTKKTVKFMSNKGMVEFDKQKGTYPDYTQLIPKDGTKIEFVASDMTEAAKALMVTAKEGSGIIRLKFTHGDTIGKINLSTHAESHDGDNESSVDCDATVESDCKIAVNARYLTDLLSQCGDSRTTIRLTTPSSPMVFDIDGKFQETIMPMFVQW